VLLRRLPIPQKKMFEFLIVVRLTTAVLKASLRPAAVGIAICSLIAISNHCAFATIATGTDSTRVTCPFHSKPAKQKQRSSQVQCCKILRAIIHGQAKSWARDDAAFSNVDLYPEEFWLIVHSQVRLVPLFLDTGPPGAHSFAELILQQSLLAHAPPFSA
jgi:hypothetical protein